VSGPLLVIIVAPLERTAAVQLIADSYEQERLALYGLRFWTPRLDQLLAELLQELADDERPAA
jgi:hypothetical protein